MAQKRGNNEGSIYKRSNGTWRAQVTLQGKRLTFTAKTKRDAQAWLRKTLDEIDNGLNFESTKTLLTTFMEEWLISIEPALRYNTIKQYEQVTHQYILPVLGNYRLRDIKPEHIQRLYNNMVKSGYGLRTVQIVHSVFHRALVHAVKLGLLARNPDDATTPPKPKRKEMLFLDENQAQQFLIAAKTQNDRFYTLYYLAIATGMRQGELLGLKWADLDWEKGELQVRRQLTKKKGGGFELTAPKTRAGIRRINLGKNTLEVLQEHRQEQFLEMQSTGAYWQDQDMVFTSKVGTPMDRSNLRWFFKKLLKDAGLPNIRFHDLRHTAASLMLNNGIPLIVVSRRLGHAQPSITLDVYGHLIPGKQQEAASLMDELLTPIQIQIEN
jgi:integrase